VLYEVKVRPKNDRQPRIIGAVYIDRDDAQVVRMAFNFTRAAFLDKALEDLFVIIENSLVNGRFWLPRQQQIEIRRGGTWLDYPIRGIIRGRWVIGDYAVNTGLSPAMFSGPEIVLAPKAERDTLRFGGRILDSLPRTSGSSPTPKCAACRRGARARACAGAPPPQGLTLSALGLSDFARLRPRRGIRLWRGIAFALRSGLSASSCAVATASTIAKGRGAARVVAFAQWGVRVFGSRLPRGERRAGAVATRSTPSRLRSSAPTIPIRTACRPSASGSRRSA
jgi:hypothetical protein